MEIQFHNPLTSSHKRFNTQRDSLASSLLTKSAGLSALFSTKRITKMYTQSPAFLVGTFYALCSKTSPGCQPQFKHLLVLALTDLSLTTLSWGYVNHENASFKNKDMEIRRG